MSVRDKDGNRVSVPNQSLIRDAGALARKLADEMRLTRLVERAKTEIAMERVAEGLDPDAKLVVHGHDFAVYDVHDGGPDSPIIPDAAAATISEMRAVLRRSEEQKLREMAEAYGMSKEKLNAHFPTEVAANSLTWDSMPSPSVFRREHLGEFQAAQDQLNNEPPDDGLEYETVARTATVRTSSARSKVKETKDTTPIYVWGLQSSKPRNGGHFITYEVQLKEDGTTSCNCPGWIFKKSSADRGCKHTRVVEEEAKEFYKKHRKGESLPTVAPSEAQLNRLANSKAGAKGTDGGDTSIKFNRVVDLD